MIRGHALQAANGHGSFLDASPPAGRLARTVARAPQNRRKYVRFPVHHVGFGVFPLRDQPDILRYIRVRRASPLAIDNSVEIRRIANVASFQKSALTWGG